MKENRRKYPNIKKEAVIMGIGLAEKLLQKCGATLAGISREKKG